MSKKCMNCGAELSEEASFCPHCATPLAEKHTVRPPRRWRKAARIGLAAVLILAAALMASALFHRPKTFEGGADVIYTDNDGAYHVLLTFSTAGGLMNSAQPEASDALAEGMTGGIPSQLYVFSEETGALACDEFLEKIDSCYIETVPADDAEKMLFSAPRHNESFPSAVLASDISFTADCGTNEILWILNMKNGDTIRLRHSVHVSRLNAAAYFPEKTPMDTLEDLQNLLADIEAEVESDTVVYLYLPPVTYDGGITLENHTFCIYGGSDGTSRTTFTGTVTVNASRGHYSEFTGICFSGNGGTGLNAHSTALLDSCSFTGWDTGAVAQDGAWVGAVNCTFENNVIGLEFDTTHSTGSAPSYPDNVFVRNETGIQINHLHGTEVLRFPGCLFSGNGADIQNPAEHPLDISGATFESAAN